MSLPRYIFSEDPSRAIFGIIDESGISINISDDDKKDTLFITNTLNDNEVIFDINQETGFLDVKFPNIGKNTWYKEDEQVTENIIDRLENLIMKSDKSNANANTNGGKRMSRNNNRKIRKTRRYNRK
jgi:hypothetical protein